MSHRLRRDVLASESQAAMAQSTAAISEARDAPSRVWIAKPWENVV